MKVLLIGSGGREHALAWKLAESPGLGELWIAPGNAGTAWYGENVDIPVNDFEALSAFIAENKVELVVVGPEEPLVKGLHDFLMAQNLPTLKGVIGPRAEGARLEGSKDFAKAFMQRHGIPTAAYQSFDAQSYEQGLAFLETLKPPYVLKADGLAAGKGVLICSELNEARAALKEMLIGKAFGQASARVVIEEFLDGIELSVFVITDGNSFKLLPSAKDYKRIGEGDTGLNTGGMGAVSPVPFADKAFMNKVVTRIVAPTVEGLKKDGIPYQGFIFVGLMNVDGEPYVIEYNVRMGDPETEVVLPRLEVDLLELFEAVVDGKLHQVQLKESEMHGVTVVMVAQGYPGAYAKGDKVDISGDVQEYGDLFFAGAQQQDEDVLTNGGRVLAFTALAPSLAQAVDKAFQGVSGIHFKGCYYRKDIGQDLMRYPSSPKQ